MFSKPDFLITVKGITHAEPLKVDERVKGNTELQIDTLDSKGYSWKTVKLKAG